MAVLATLPTRCTLKHMEDAPQRPRLIALKIIVACALLAVILFVTAGRYDLWFQWAYVASYAVLVTVGLRVIDPDLIHERITSARRDRIPLASAVKVLTWIHLIVAGVDAGRYHWSPVFPAWLHVVGLAGMSAGFGVVIWSMAVNRFFVPTVRLQPERGHHLITTGPYAYVRHPGYAGIVLGVLASGVALGSWVSLIPMAALIAAIVGRLRNEDRFLQENLEGYKNYATEVRARLIPFVW